MMHRRLLMAACLAAAGVATICFAAQDAGESRPANAADTKVSEFAGKYLVINDTQESGAVLVEAKIQTLGGQPFLVGKGAAVGGPWKVLEDKTVWVELQHVTQIAVFDTLDEAKRYLEEPDELDENGIAATRRPHLRKVTSDARGLTQMRSDEL